MKKFAILVACAALATFAVGCDDEDENPPGGGGGSGPGGSGGGGGDGGTGGGVCGDGNIDAAAGEECDDGNTVGGDGCEADCTDPVVTAVCGDSVVAGAEECDDGNTADGDNCSADCAESMITIAGSAALNPIVARWYFANGMATPSFEGFRIRAVDPLLSLAFNPALPVSDTNPDPTLGESTIAADGSFSFPSAIITSDVGLGIVLTVNDPVGTAAGSETIASSTIGACQKNLPAPLADCSADVAGARAYVVPLDFVRALETGANGGDPLISDTEGFVLGGVMDTNGEPVGGASVTSATATPAYFDAALQPWTQPGTEPTTGGFFVQPTGIATLAAEKAGTSFVSASATVGKSAGVAFQVFFLVPVAAPGCGNNVVDAGEECDPPSTATCDATCHLLPVCGDGAVTGAEKCDDGNTADGDHCSADCMDTFITVTGVVSANPLAASIHAATATALPAVTGLTVLAIEPVAMVTNPDPTASTVGMAQAAADGTFTMQVKTTTVTLGLLVAVTDGDPTTTDMWAMSAMALCAAPNCSTDLLTATAYAVTDHANTILEGATGADLLSDPTGYILGMTLDVSTGAPVPAGGVSVTGMDSAGVAVTDAETYFLAPGGAFGFQDNGTELTSDGVGAFISTHMVAGLTNYTASLAGMTFSSPTQPGIAAPGLVFQMFFLGAPTP